MMDSVGQYHSTDDPYDVVTAVFGGDDLHRIAKVVKDLRVLSGVPHVYDYTTCSSRPVDRSVYVVKDRRGLRLLPVKEFDQVYGEKLSEAEAERWKKASPITIVDEGVTRGSVSFKNGRTTSMYLNVFGNNDEELREDAIRQGRRHFGENARLTIDLSPSRLETLGPHSSPKRYYTWASVRVTN